MATRDEIVDDVMWELLGAFGELDGTCTATTTGQTTLTMTIGGESIRVGDLVELDYELAKVYGVVTADTEYRIHRAQRGTTAANYSADQRVRIQPRWYRQRILDQLVNACQALPRDLYGVSTTDVSFGANSASATLGSAGDFDNKKVLGVRAVHRDPLETVDRHNRVNLELLRDPQKGSFASGYGVQLAHGDWTYNTASTLRVTYVHTFDFSTVASTNVDFDATIGMGDELVQALKYDMMWRLQSTRELARARESAVGQARDDQAIPPGYNIEIARDMRAMRDLLYDEERARLINEWPRLFRRD